MLHENAVTADAEHGFTFVSFDGTTLVLTASGEAEVAVGDVVAGTDGGGFLVHAVTVDRSGDTLTIGTTPASLAEYVLAGSVTAEVQPEVAPARHEGSSASKTAAFLVSHTFTPIDLSNHVLYDQNGIEVKITSGEVEFTPSLYAHAVFQNYVYLTYLEIWADGALHFNLQLDVTGDYTNTFAQEWSPGRVNLPVTIPLAPGVVAGVYLDFRAGFDATGEFHGQSSFGSERTYNVRVGLLYKDGAWTNLSTAGAPVSVDKPFTIDTYLAGNVTGYIRGEIGVTVNGVLGAGLTLGGDVAANVTHQTPPEQFTWSLTGGLDLGYNAWAKVWSWSLFDQSDSIFGADIALGNGILTPGSGGASTGTWRQSGHDQSHRGRVAYDGPVSPVTTWSRFASLSGGLAGNSPTVGADGTIYIGGESGYLYAFNPDGTEKWKYDAGVSAKIYSAPAIASDGTIYFG
ncbi:MAG: PQQ-binding-like beta-propeller repeat protein, partial [bacterium]|nr:PQQ-binding-like beta-propeller repeat protein [bacterium]